MDMVSARRRQFLEPTMAPLPNDDRSLRYAVRSSLKCLKLPEVMCCNWTEPSGRGLQSIMRAVAQQLVQDMCA